MYDARLQVPSSVAALTSTRVFWRLLVAVGGKEEEGVKETHLDLKVTCVTSTDISLTAA